MSDGRKCLHHFAMVGRNVGCGYTYDGYTEEREIKSQRKREECKTEEYEYFRNQVKANYSFF